MSVSGGILTNIEHTDSFLDTQCARNICNSDIVWDLVHGNEWDKTAILSKHKELGLEWF